MSEIKKLVNRIDQLFEKNRDLHKTHELAVPILKEASHQKYLIREIIKKHLTEDMSLNRGHYPVLELPVNETQNYSLMALFWLPHPGNRTDISTRTVHHHGAMLNTSVCCFGPGYENWLFSKPSCVNSDKELFSMQLRSRTIQHKHQVVFIDTSEAHCPFYPPGLTVTLVLKSHLDGSWSPSFVRMREVLRRVFKQKKKRYYDYCPTPFGFSGLSQPHRFELGPNEDYLYSLFHIVQSLGFEDLSGALSSQLGAGRVKNKELFSFLMAELSSGHPIASRISENHFGIPYANFNAEQINGALMINSKKAEVGLSQSATYFHSALSS